jgi:type VI secretion system secreted protein VgrG
MSSSTNTTSSAHVRFLSMTAPKGVGPFTPVRFSASEALTEPYLVAIDVLSPQKNIDPAKLLYQPVCLTVTHPEGPVRYFHGIVRRLRTGASETRDQWPYVIEVVPRLWFMAQTQDSRIFQQQTAADILQKLFSDAGVTSVQYKILGEKPTREYTVQMNETDLAFVTRLIQEEGWFYFFQHSADDHTLIISNQNTTFQMLDASTMKIVKKGYEYATLNSWRPINSTTHGQTVLRDYDLTNPSNPPEATQNTVLKAAGASARDAFQWPALTTVAPLVTDRTRKWIEAEEVVASLIEGTGRNVAFCPGFKFTLELDPVTGNSNQAYVIRSVVHQGTSSVGWSGGPAETYRNSFTCFPAGNTWRERRTLPRPRMFGIFTAMVIGPDGEEIYTDNYARVKVLFPWDRRKDSTPGGSVWLRVIQPWAGKTWGWQYIPRVGTEVAVAFMDGDVDRPVVIGGLYNADYMPPFALPDQKTKSGLRTRSSLNGGTSNFSEFSIDDKMGQELVFLHCEKDHTIEVEHDQKLTVDNCRVKEVKADETVTIGQNQKIEIQKGNRDVKLDQGNDSLLLSMGNLSTKLSMGNMAVELSMGNLSTKADVGQISEEALQSITMKVGQNSITIDQMGVTIKGLMISIQGQIQTEVKGLMTTVSGDVMLQNKGAIIMIGP